MIEQQIYTRLSDSREGGGFGTVAASPDLSPADLASFEALCSYNVPFKKINSAKPENNPKIRFLAVKDKYAVIGQSVYRSDDGRSTFLTHNYIADIREDPDFFNNISPLVSAEGFLSEPPVDGKLEAIEKIPCPELNYLLDKDSVFYKTGLTDGLFAALIASVFSAISHSRKIFISLPCATNDIDKNARALMRLLFAAIPPALRSEMSYTTYFCEGSTNSGIRIYFADASLLPEAGPITQIGDRSTKQDCVFDLKNSRIQNADSGRNSMYVSHTLKNLSTNNALDKFFAVSSSLLTSLLATINDAEGKRETLSDIRIYDLIALAESACKDSSIPISYGISGLLDLFTLVLPTADDIAMEFIQKTLACYAKELAAKNQDGSAEMPDKRVFTSVCALANTPALAELCAEIITQFAAISLNESSAAMLKFLSRVKAENDDLYVALMNGPFCRNDALFNSYMLTCLSEADDYPLLFSFYLRQRLCYSALTDHPKFPELFLKRCDELKTSANCTLSAVTLVSQALNREASLHDDELTSAVYNAIISAILTDADLAQAAPYDFTNFHISPLLKITSKKIAEKISCVSILRDICESMLPGKPAISCDTVPAMLEGLPVNAAACEAQIKTVLSALFAKGFFSKDSRTFGWLLYCCDSPKDMLRYFAHCPDLLPDFMPYFAGHTSSSIKCREFLSAAVHFYCEHHKATENYAYIFEKYDLARENKSFAFSGEPFKDRILDIYLSHLSPIKRIFMSLITQKYRK